MKLIKAKIKHFQTLKTELKQTLEIDWTKNRKLQLQLSV